MKLYLRLAQGVAIVHFLFILGLLVFGVVQLVLPAMAPFVFAGAFLSIVKVHE